MENVEKFTYMVLKESVVVGLKNGPLTINKDDPRYNKVLEMIRSGNLSLDEMEKVLDPSISWKGTGLELRDNLLYPEGQTTPLPLELSNRILDYRKKDLSFESLLKFWEKLKKNPSFNSRKSLFQFLEHNGHPFTEEGNFLAYRSITADFKDHHTKKFDNSIGAVCEVDRSEVDDNPNNTCSNGLHVAAWKYACEFGNSDRKLVEVEVDPADVVTVPTDYNGTKMRVCRFKVLKEVDAPNNQTIYGRDDEPEETFDNNEDDDGWDEVDSNDSEFSNDMIDEVNRLADQYEANYSSDLASRIAEECSYDEEDIQKILDDHRSE